jgi:hypothetical protein
MKYKKDILKKLQKHGYNPMKEAQNKRIFGMELHEYELNE